MQGLFLGKLMGPLGPELLAEEPWLDSLNPRKYCWENAHVDSLLARVYLAQKSDRE